MSDDTTTVNRGSTAATRTYGTKAFAARDAGSPLVPMEIRRREPGPRDVRLEILYCGVCHSDLHQVRNEWEDAMPKMIRHAGLAPEDEKKVLAYVIAVKKES